MVEISAPPSASEARAQLLWRAGFLLVGLILPALALPDAILADSHSIRVKERVLTLAELFHPAQTEVVNIFYRPLFSVLHGLTDRLFGHAMIGLRLLALVCHGYAAWCLASLVVTLGHPRRVSLLAMLLFLLVPGNVFTAIWPVVAYWSLAAAWTFGAIGCWVRFQAEGRPRDLLAALGLAVLALLTSQTPYHLVAFGGLLALVPAVAPERRGARRRALLTWPLFAALALVHFRFFETSAQVLAESSVLDRLGKALETLPTFWVGVLGGDHLVGRPTIALALALLLPLVLLGRQRRHLFLLLFALAAPLPFAALGFSDRTAYFSTGITALLVVSLLREALPQAFSRSSARRLVNTGCAALLAITLLVLTRQSWLRLEEVRQADRETAVLLEDLERLVPDLPEVNRVAFINWPRMLKWPLNDLLGVRRPEDLVEPRALAYFATDTRYFCLGDPDLSASFEAAVVCENGRLVRRDPRRPMGERTPIPELWYLAETVEVFDPALDFGSGPLAARRRREALLEYCRRLEDPRRVAVVEELPPGLTPPLAVLPSSVFRVERETAGRRSAAEMRAQGVRFPGRLVADLDLPRAGLLVVITWFAAPDPILRVSGSMGRFCDLMQVSVDGRPVPVVPVYYHCTGAVIPAGRHHVEVRQRPIGAPPEG